MCQKEVSFSYCTGSNHSAECHFLLCHLGFFFFTLMHLFTYLHMVAMQPYRLNISEVITEVELPFIRLPPHCKCQYPETMWIAFLYLPIATSRLYCSSDIHQLYCHCCQLMTVSQHLVNISSCTQYTCSVKNVNGPSDLL